MSSSMLSFKKIIFIWKFFLSLPLYILKNKKVEITVFISYFAVAYPLTTVAVISSKSSINIDTCTVILKSFVSIFCVPMYLSFRQRKLISSTIRISFSFFFCEVCEILYWAYHSYHILWKRCKSFEFITIYVCVWIIYLSVVEYVSK